MSTPLQDRPVRWWEAPPLRTNRAGARAAASKLLAGSVRFNRCQTVALLDIACTWRAGRVGVLEHHLAFLGAMLALAECGGWVGLPSRPRVGGGR